jgi:3-phosphoshikimate 1-carboxyvinyltransferase
VNRNLRQVKRLAGSVDIESSYRSALRIALLALFAEGTTVINSFPKSVASERLIQFLQSTFPGIVDRKGSVVSITGVGSFTSDILPAEINTGTDSVLLMHLLPLYLRRGGKFRCDNSSFVPRVHSLLKHLDKIGFYLEVEKNNDEQIIKITPSSPDSVHMLLDNADEELKSAMLFALLNASGNSRIIESTPLPDESEIILKKMKAQVTSFRKGELLSEEDEAVSENMGNDDELMRRIRKIKAKKEAASSEKPTRTIQMAETTRLIGTEFSLNGAHLCAAPFLLAGLLVNHSSITVRGIEGSATSGIFSVLRRMGAQFRSERTKDKNAFDTISEPAKLVGRKISGELSADAGELIPFVAVAAAYAEGQTVIRDADFLRCGEKDIISLTLNNLKAMGVKVGEIEDGFVVEGAREYDGAEYETGGVPSVGLAFAVAAVKNKGESVLRGAEAVDAVFPDFFHRLESLVKEDKTVSEEQ